MAAPARPEPLHHIKSAARKLPVKRKPNSSDPSAESASPRAPFSIIVDDGEGDGDDPFLDSSSDASPRAAPNNAHSAVPFKFQRIWSEADEVRFLKGLLSSHTDGLLFPRDLNAFFDRFSHDMPQPYTRSQLSEKLRRLRKKFRIVSSRILRGMDLSALSGHDHELYHLSCRLWDPAFALSSPFGTSGSDASKRRRRMPPSPPLPDNPIETTAVLTPPAEDFNNRPADGQEKSQVEERLRVDRETTDSGVEPVKMMVMKILLDVFEGAVKEVKTSSGECGDLVKRWEEQQVLELNVLARRLRLGMEDAFQE